MPPRLNARSMFIAAAAFAYARTIRLGSGIRSSGSGVNALTMSPR